LVASEEGLNGIRPPKIVFKNVKPMVIFWFLLFTLLHDGSIKIKIVIIFPKRPSKKLTFELFPKPVSVQYSP